MAATTPDAYRIGAGQVAQDYPADAAPVRARKQPSLPTMARVPESVSSDEQVITAEVAVVRRKAAVTPAAPKGSRPSKDAATVARQSAATREGVPGQGGHVAQSPALAREYAQNDEVGVTFESDQHPGVAVHRDWHRTTMRIVGHSDEARGGQQGIPSGAEGVPVREGIRSSSVGGASRREAEARRSGHIESRLARRERPARRGGRHHGLVMFLFGFLAALVLVGAVVAGLYMTRPSVSTSLSDAVDSCHAEGIYARLSSDQTSLTLEGFNDSGNGLTTPIFQCVLRKLGTPSSVRERMYATRAIDGTQSEEWGSYKATWTYEPDQGLTVIISAR